MPIAAAKVGDPEIQAALVAVAKVIDQHIQKGIDKAEVELMELSNFPDFGA